MSTAGLNISLRERVRDTAQHRCGYCQSSQKYVMGKLEIEHIVPQVHGGSEEESNLWLSCSLCNRYKGAQIAAKDPQTNTVSQLFNPRTQNWNEHFQWRPDGTHIIGITAVGRATVAALNLNNDIAVEVRRNWVMAGWHPPNN